MSKEPEQIKIKDEDLSYLTSELALTNKPVHLDVLTKKLAFKKTESQLNKPVKKYDPNCRYEIGDLIYKEYDEPLMISSKGTEEFKGGVVLNVVNKIPYDSYNCEMLEVDYTGGGSFRKHIDYMKKTKTQVLLPSNIDGKNIEPEALPNEKDPRRHELPLTEKDLKALKKNLRKALSSDKRFFSWENFWQLEDKRLAVPAEKISAMENHIQSLGISVPTETLTSDFLNIPSSDENFELACMSLNYILTKKYKKKFIHVFPENWGKWHLKKSLEAMKKDLPLSSPKANLPEEAHDKPAPDSSNVEYPLKIYLTWREILSGAIRMPEVFKKELSRSIEYIFRDTENDKEYSVFFFPSLGAFLGLKEYYEEHHIPQGASLTLERKSPSRFSFWLKASKKKLSVARVVYDPKTDRFQKAEEVFTFAVPNKIIHLEEETLDKLFTFYEKQEQNDLRELLILIYKNFSLEDEPSLHYLRAFHMVDMLKQTSQEDVERTLLASPEFIESEKNKGVFIYKEKIKTEEEISQEEKVEETPSRPPSLSETIKEQILQEERRAAEAGESPAEEEPEAEEITEETQAELMEKEMPHEPQIKEEEEEEKILRLEKETKKKKIKEKIIEPEKAPRRRKGEKKHLEERIEMEESEQEALFAIKTEEEKEEETPAETEKEEKEKFEPSVSPPPSFGGIFAEKLKSALEEKKKDKKKK